MGHHQSKQTIDESTRVAANIVQNTAQNCISVAYGNNTVAINGNYNDVSDVAQKVSVKINSNCSTFANQNNTFKSDLQNSVGQTLSDQEIAFMEWMDNSRDTQKTNIDQSVTTNFTQSAVQNCVNSLSGDNNLYVSGNGNVIKNIVQNSTLDMISQCLLGNGQTSSVVSDITNTVNQHSTYTSKSPFQFIADAFTSIAKSVIAAAAILFIIVVCFVLMIVAMGHSPTPQPVQYVQTRR